MKIKLTKDQIDAILADPPKSPRGWREGKRPLVGYPSQSAGLRYRPHPRRSCNHQLYLTRRLDARLTPNELKIEN